MKKFFAVLLCAFLVHGCKKKDPPPAPAPYSPPADGSISVATSFYGVFTTGVYATQVAPGIIYQSINCRAWVGNQPSQEMNTNYSVKAGRITLNGDSLLYNSSSKYYQQNFSVPVNLDTEIWNVQGGNGISAFTHSNSVATPSFTGEENLPDSVSKSAGVTILINDVSSTSYAVIYLMDDASRAARFQLKPGNNILTFSPQQLSFLKTTNNGEIYILLQNTMAYVYGSKDFQFQRENQFTKKLKIKE